jgi:asparagine synthase (glutamine-hydrolysing)
MSGVVGFIHFPPDELESLRTKSAECLCRFPWNTWDWYSDPSRTIGLGRAEIGIFNPQPQPVSSSDGKLLSFFSGELYRSHSLRNRLEANGCQFIRHDDPEFVLFAYEKLGDSFISELEGVFHLVILDLRSHTLLVANDRFGLRPLYWTKYKDRLVFAPEVKALLFDPDFQKRLNPVAVDEYMRFQMLLGDKTFFQGIELLPPASFLRFDLKTNTLKILPYWSFDNIDTNKSKVSYADILRESARLFQEAVEIRCSKSHKEGIYLSGGVDSRLLAASLAKKHSPVLTLTFGNRNSIDVALAAKVAAVLKSDHHYFEFTDGRWILDWADLHFDLTEGYHSWIHCDGISTYEKARDWIDINLTGWDIGGTLGSRWRHPLLYKAVDRCAFECALYHFYSQQHTWPGLTDAEEYSLYTEKSSSVLNGLAFESLQAEARKLEAFSFLRRADYFYLLQHARKFTFYRVIAANAFFENRIPSHDYRLFDFIYSYPQLWPSSKQVEKDIIEMINPKLALIPDDKSGLLFTHNNTLRGLHHLWTRSKQRINRHLAPIFRQPVSLYADWENWLRSELKEWAAGLLLDGRLEQRGMFDIDSVRSLFERHLSGKERHTIGKIAPIMTLELVLRRFFD